VVRRYAVESGMFERVGWSDSGYVCGCGCVSGCVCVREKCSRNCSRVEGTAAVCASVCVNAFLCVCERESVIERKGQRLYVDVLIFV